MTQRETLQAARDILLPLHKLLLDRQRGEFEKANGPVSSPGQFLQLILSHADFEWLRRLSGLIVAIDEALAPRSKADAATEKSLLEQTAALLKLDENGDEFQRKYYQAIQESPDVVIAQCRLEKLVGQASAC